MAVIPWRAEPRSTVAFDIEPDDKGVARLTVADGDFGPGSRVLQGVSAGWPAVLASLKTALETGSPLPWQDGENRPGQPRIDPGCTAILTAWRGRNFDLRIVRDRQTGLKLAVGGQL
jgi:hypothetical protein